MDFLNDCIAEEPVLWSFHQSSFFHACYAAGLDCMHVHICTPRVTLCTGWQCSTDWRDWATDQNSWIHQRESAGNTKLGVLLYNSCRRFAAHQFIIH